MPNDSLRRLLENFNTGAPDGYHWNLRQRQIEKDVLSFLTEQVALARSEERERAALIARQHLLTDWSGEAEVEKEINDIALKILSPAPIIPEGEKLV